MHHSKKCGWQYMCCQFLTYFAASTYTTVRQQYHPTKRKFNIVKYFLCYAYTVIINVDNCYHGEIRLVGGRSEEDGRVEICYYNNRWGTICDNEWSDRHTAVVCRYLGFSDIIGGILILLFWRNKVYCILCQLYTLDSAYYTSERFGRGTGPIFMDYINCTGSEVEMWEECSHFTHYYGCSHNDDVGIQCRPGL